MGKGSGGRLDNWETAFGVRDIFECGDFVSINSDGVVEVSPDAPTGRLHMQWIIAASDENIDAIEKIRPWLESNGEKGEHPSVEDLQAAAREIWKVHGK